MMLFKPAGGGGINIAHNFAEVVGRIETAKSQMPAAKMEAMKAVGVQVLSWAFQDFRAKSRSETVGGVQWVPITDAALVSRLAKRAPWKAVQAAKRSLHGMPEMPADLKKKLPKGTGERLNKVRAAIIWAYRKKHPEYDQAIRKAQAERAKLRGKRNALLAKEKTGAKIGVDTGRLANSLKFGQRGNVYDVKTTSVTVGSHIEYAKFFDEKRPIFGPQFLNAERKQKLDKLVERVVKKVEKMLGGG